MGYLKPIAALTATLSILGILAAWSLLPSNLETLKVFFAEHPLVGPIVIILWRIIGIVIPPIPGGILSISLIPVFGWWWSFVYAAIGLIIGTSISFWLARIFRERVVKVFVPLQQIHQWEDKLSNKTEFFAFLGIRLTTGPVMDFISYVAGLSKMSYKHFLGATIIALIPDLIIYYIGDSIYNSLYQKSSYLAGGILIILIIIIYLHKSSFFPFKIPFKKGRDE